METKKIYIAPIIGLVLLDKNISLALESEPPIGPDENTNVIAPTFFNNDPWKTNLT